MERGPAPDPSPRHEFYHERTVAADREDVDYYLSLATDVAGPVLEMACGTGRVTLPLLAAGVDVDGFDRSAGALAVLRRRADEQGLDPSVWQADMRHFGTDRPYDLVICPFNTVQHLRTIDEQLQALEVVYGALQRGGRLCFDVFVPSFEQICEAYGTWQRDSVEFRGEAHTFRTRTTIADEVEQSIRVERELLDPDGERMFQDSFELTLLPKPRVELLAQLSPFEEWTVTGNYADRPLRDGDDVQVWTLRKRTA